MGGDCLSTPKEHLPNSKPSCTEEVIMVSYKHYIVFGFSDGHINLHIFLQIFEQKTVTETCHQRVDGVNYSFDTAGLQIYPLNAFII